MVLSILGINFLSNNAYAIIAPFLPFELKRKQVPQFWIGYVFSIYSVAIVISSPIIGKMMSTYGRRNFAVLGLLLMGLSFISFGLSSYI